MRIDEGSGHNWLFMPEISKGAVFENEQSFFEDPVLFKTVIESIQDGVSILDSALEIKYVNSTMRHIYADRPDFIGKKCHDVYHSQNTPCEGCPTLEVLKTAKPQIGLVKCSRGHMAYDWHQIFSIPVLNKRGDVILIIEYIRDVTFQNQLKENLNDLEARIEMLEKKNEILSSVLSRQKESRDELERTISDNVERFVKPSLEYLKKTVRPEDVELIDGLIDEIIYPVMKRRDSALKSLTPREMQVAVMIKAGDSSQEIADKLCITQKAVDYHRLNIRKKLKLARSVNLHVFLKTHL